MSSNSDIGGLLEESLGASGNELTVCRNAVGALELIRSGETFALVLLSQALPDMDGIELVPEIASGLGARCTPIIVMGSGDLPSDRFRAFEHGASDFIGTPFSVPELLHRIRLQLEATLRPPPRVVAVGVLRLDREAHRAWVANRLLTLSRSEFRTLEFLMDRGERVVSRQALLAHLWDANETVKARAVYARIARLKRKLGSARDYLQTVPGVGFRLTCR